VSLARNVLVNWVGLVTSVCYAFLITPLVIRGLDHVGYGIWSLLNALVGYSSLFYFGLGTALVRFGAHHYASGDRAALNRLLSVVFSICAALATAALLVGLVIAPAVPRWFLAEPSSAEVLSISFSVIALAARVSSMFIGSVFGGVLIVQGRMDLTGVVAIAGNLFRLALVPWTLSTGNPLLGLALLVAVTGALEAIAVAVFAMRLDSSLRIRLVIPKGTEVKSLYGFGIFAFFLQAADKIISYTDVVVIGFLLGPAQVGLYSVPLQLVEYGRLIGRGFVSVLLPHLAALHAQRGIEGLARAYIRTVRTSTLIAVFVMANLVLVGPRFLTLWVGPEFSGRAILLWLSLAGLVQAISAQAQLQFCHALGRNRFPAILMIFEGAVNLALSFLLAKMVGTVGVAFATAAAAVLISGLGLPFYVGRLLGTRLRDLLHKAVVPAMILIAMMVPSQLLFDALVPHLSYGILCVNAVWSLFVALTTAWFLATAQERRLARVASGRFRARYFARKKTVKAPSRLTR